MDCFSRTTSLGKQYILSESSCKVWVKEPTSKHMKVYGVHVPSVGDIVQGEPIEIPPDFPKTDYTVGMKVGWKAGEDKLGNKYYITVTIEAVVWFKDKNQVNYFFRLNDGVHSVSEQYAKDVFIDGRLLR